MNLHEANELLGARLEDPGEDTFFRSVKVPALNRSELMVARKLHDAYLSGLWVVEEGVSVTDGQVALSDLSNPPLRGAQSIEEVKIASGGRIMNRINLGDRKRTQAGGTWEPTERNPMFDVVGKNIRVYPEDVSSVDITYMKSPAPLYYPFKGYGTGSPDSILIKDQSGLDWSFTANELDGAVVYFSDPSVGWQYRVITDSTTPGGAVSLEPANSYTFTGEEFYFLTHDFDMLRIINVTFSLPPELHYLIVLAAAADLWPIDKEYERAAAERAALNEEIEILNARYRPAEGVGTGRRE